MHLHRDGGRSGNVPRDEGRVGPTEQDMEGKAGGVVSTAAVCLLHLAFVVNEP